MLTIDIGNNFLVFQALARRAKEGDFVIEMPDPERMVLNFAVELRHLGRHDRGLVLRLVEHGAGLAREGD